MAFIEQPPRAMVVNAQRTGRQKNWVLLNWDLGELVSTSHFDKTRSASHKGFSDRKKPCAQDAFIWKMSGWLH